MMDTFLFKYPILTTVTTFYKLKSYLVCHKYYFLYCLYDICNVIQYFKRNSTQVIS